MNVGGRRKKETKVYVCSFLESCSKANLEEMSCLFLSLSAQATAEWDDRS